MATTNERLRDAAVAHALGIERYKAGVIRQIVSLLDRVDNDLVSLIARRNVTEFNRERLNKLLRAVRELIKTGNQRYFEALRGELQGLAAYEIDFQARTLGRHIPDGIVADLGIVAPAAGTVYAAVVSRPFNGRLLREWANGLERSTFVAVRDAIRIGVVEGETIDQIVRRIRGTKAVNYRDGVMEITRRNAEAVVRTAVNHTVTRARELTYQANADIVKGVQWVSTLDARTTELCMSLDGKVFPLDSGPRPPAHINCRSVVVPILKSYRELGFDRDEIPGGTRASMNGQVPDSVTYGEWLKRQPVAVQNEALGRRRAQLFRTGQIDVSRFVDSRGRTYTLDELRKREAAAFEAAGL